MFFKKKCPTCGAKNPKENMTCRNCGAPLELGRSEGPAAKEEVIPLKQDDKQYSEKLEEVGELQGEGDLKFSMEGENTRLVSFPGGKKGVVVDGTIEQGTIRDGDEVLIGGHQGTIYEVKAPKGKGFAVAGQKVTLAIVTGMIEALKVGTQSSVSLSALSDGMPKGIRLIVKAARQGDALSKKMLLKSGGYLGVATAGLINLFDPELLILSGFVITESDGMILDIVRKTAIEHILPEKARSIRIEEGILGRDAAIIGASALLCESVFANPIKQTEG